MLEGHGELVLAEELLQDAFHVHWFGAKVEDAFCNSVYLVDVVLSQFADVVGSGGMGGDKEGCFHGFYLLQGIKVGGNVVNVANLVFVQRFFAGEAVSKKNDVIWRAEADHVEEVAWQRQHLHACWQLVSG